MDPLARDRAAGARKRLEELESPKTFFLLTPFEGAEKDSVGTITEITLREPTAGDIAQIERDTAKEGATEAIVRLVARQTKLPPVDVRKIGARDFNRMSEYFGGFFAPSEMKGETSES